MQHRQRDLAVLDVVADALAHDRLLAHEVEAVVDDLEGQADRVAELGQQRARLVAPAGVARAEFAGRAVEHGGLGARDALVGLLGHLEVVAQRRLLDLPHADAARGLGEHAARQARGEVGREREGARVEEVAQQHRGLVVPALVDAGHAPAHLGAVEHVVVDQRGEVDQLDDRRDRGVLVGRVAGRVARQQHQRSAQLLAAEPAHVAGHVVHRARALGDLRLEDRTHARQAFADGLDQARQACIGGAHRRAASSSAGVFRLRKSSGSARACQA